MSDIQTWSEFFATVDGLPEADEREELIALLHRSFAAAGAPWTWPEFADETPKVQKRLGLCYQAWMLPDVEWIAHKGGIAARDLGVCPNRGINGRTFARRGDD